MPSSSGRSTSRMDVMEGTTVRLRGHHLLCVWGFRGLGYNLEFVQNLWDVVGLLEATRERDGEIEIVEGPDDICRACPHLFGVRCRRGGLVREDKIKAQDAWALIAVDLLPGRHSWKEVTARVATQVPPERLGQLCGECVWLPQGYCSQGIESMALPRMARI